MIEIGSADSTRKKLKWALNAILALLLASGGGMKGEQGGETADQIFSRALNFADLYNWNDAAPLFARAEGLFRRQRKARNALYAHLGALRLVPKQPIITRSQEIGRLLVDSNLLQSDKQLRLFALSVKGDLDGEIDSSAARIDWTAVLQLATELNVPKWIYRAQGQIGFADYYDGDLASCQRNVASALIAATKKGDVGAEIFFLSATANGYLFQGMPRQAIDYARQAIAISISNPESGYPDIAYDVLGNSLLEVGNLAEVKQLSLNGFRLARNPVMKGEALFLASKVASAEGDNSNAISSLESALVLIRGYGENRVARSWESDLSKLYMIQGNLVRAEALARTSVSSIEERRPTTVLPEYLNRLNNFAQILIKRGKYTEANDVYQRASFVEDTVIGKADTVLLKTALITGSSNFYANHFALLADQLDNPTEAYGVIEQERGRTIADLLASGKAISPKAIQLQNEIAGLRLKLANAHSTSEIRRIRDSIFLAHQLGAVNPGITILSTKNFRPVDLRTLQSSLTAYDVILEYVLSEPNSYCLVITKTSSRIVRLSGKATIEARVSNYLSLIKQKRAAREQAADLYKYLLGVIEEYGKAHRLIVVPDGNLHLLPFDALIDATQKYIVESKTVLYSPSSTSFYLLKSPRRIPANINGLLAIGAVPYGSSSLRQIAQTRGYVDSPWDLPASGPEVMAAAAELRKFKNTLLMNREATEAEFKKEISRPYRFIHLAVHAFPDDDPDRAALMLLSDPLHGEDGFLQASEIVQMRLIASLVVLSACETGVGPIEGQEGIATLSTSFLLAGARNIVSTLWPIEDEPSLFLMTHFYRQLSRNLPPADSMARAKREMLKTFGPESLPFYWAGFIVEGSDAL